MSLDYSLQFAIEKDIIPLDELRSRIDMYERQYYLEMHKHKIWQCADGRWCTYLPDTTKGKNRRLIKRKARKSIEDEIISWNKEYANEPKIEDIFLAWVNDKLAFNEIKQQTYDRYVCDFEKYFKGKTIYHILFRHITEGMIKDFVRTSIRDYKLTSKGWANLRTIIYGVFRYGKEKGYTSISITGMINDLPLSRNVFRRKKVVDEESVFNADEIAKIEKHISTQQESVIHYGILLGFETGLRIGEIAALKMSDIDLDEGTAIIQRKETKCKDQTGHTVFIIEENTKGRDGARKIVLTDKAVNIIRKARRLNPFAEFLFTNPRTGKRVHNTYFSITLRKICQKIGIPPRSMHKARKTYATRLFNSGVRETLIMNQMGHTDITTTRRHYIFNNATDAEAKKEIRAAMGEKTQPISIKHA